MKKKPVVWYVDDLPENLRQFQEHHAETFSIRTFDRPEEVVSALATSKPDALLCDVFFYETLEFAREMEDKVRQKATELKKFGDDIGASRTDYQAGIRLMEIASERFGHNFPVYAYTSKGPYLLTEIGFDRVGEAGARWLFKGKFSPSVEQLILLQDIDEFRARNSFVTRVARFFWIALFGSGILGGLVVWFLTEALPKLLGSDHHP